MIMVHSDTFVFFLKLSSASLLILISYYIFVVRCPTEQQGGSVMRDDKAISLRDFRFK